MSDKHSRSARNSTKLRRLFHSFRFRLTLLFVVILALLLAGFSVFIYTRQVQIIHAEVVNRLATQSAQLTAYFSSQLLSADEEREGRSNQTSPAELPLLPEHTVLALIGLNGNVVLQQDSLGQDVLKDIINTWNASPVTMEAIEYTVPKKDDQDLVRSRTYLFEVSPLQHEGGLGGYILLASPLDPEGQLPRLAVTLGLASVLILILAFGGGYWLADRAMRPVQAIVKTARRIGESDLNQRINLNREDELGELADTFDQMLDRLQAAFERQRQFTADASHELRSPLTLIELETNRALERPRTQKEYQHALTLIQSENEWMSRLVNQMLLLARMDAGKTELHAERLDLSELVVDVIERLNSLAQARGVALKTGILEECYVRADRIYLSQLLTNLVENAIKYTQSPDGQVMVESAKAVVDEKEWSLVRIMDNGPGIPEEQLPYIFTRFYRLDKARSRQVGEDDEVISGSGLGLAIAKSIAEFYKGKIEVQSQVNIGTAFTVRLPAK